MDYLEQVAKADVARLREEEDSYGGSWKRRGGVGAFMMLARKWDRIEHQVDAVLVNPAQNLSPSVDRWDIFEHIKADHRPEGLLADIQDLRCYLMLVEAEMICRQDA
jgi:hypothetical protein